MVTESEKRLMIKVNNDINPCHKPIQKPAVDSINFSLPGVQDVSKRAINTKNSNGLKLNLFFMIWDLG